MGAGHSHGPAISATPTVRRTVAAILIPLLLATVTGLIVLWPRGDAPIQTTDDVTRHRGRVESATPPCPPGTPAGTDGTCGTAVVRIGADAVPATVPSGASAPRFAAGDRVVVVAQGDRYAVVDHDRSTGLFLLIALFFAVVIAFGRWRGLASLAGLAATFAILLAFILPAIQRGTAPLPVAIVGSAAIMFAMLYLTHGFSVTTSISVLGTIAALALTGLLGLLVTAVLQLTGSGSDEAAILTNVLAGVDLRGLLLAGIIIGTLGCLDDITVTQTAIVGELAAADPRLTVRQRYAAAMRVGRTHVAAVVNTIILAYAGAALPLLLLIVTAGTGTGDVLTTQLMATEIVRGVVGTLGLIAAVPITTALAAAISANNRNNRPAQG